MSRTSTFTPAMKPATIGTRATTSVGEIRR
jgi:hypothetical protein